MHVSPNSTQPEVAGESTHSPKTLGKRAPKQDTVLFCQPDCRKGVSPVVKEMQPRVWKNVEHQKVGRKDVTRERERERETPSEGGWAG